jgi:hypothetical protein
VRRGGMGMHWTRFKRAAWQCAVAGLLLWPAVSCRTVAPLPPVNLHDAGWTMRQGQALWRSKRDAPEIAGEIIFARHTSGQTLLQLTKNPLPFVTAQTKGEIWQIEFVPQHRRFSGKGVPTNRLLWVHLARALNGTAPPPPLQFKKDGADFTFENPATGESISGFLGQ